MTRSGLFYALLCLGVVALYFFSARAGYSPYAAGGSRPSFFFFGGRSYGGPHHK